MDIRKKIFFNYFVEILPLGIALGMHWCCLEVFAVTQDPQFIRKLVAEFFTTIGMNSLRSRKTVDSVVEDVRSHRSSLLVRNRHHDRNFCQAEDMFISAVGFQWAKEIGVDPNIRCVRNW